MKRLLLRRNITRNLRMKHLKSGKAYIVWFLLLCGMVYAYPMLWEVGLIGAIAAALWVFVWPSAD